jgi:sugar O-acyltransferase (sialic acid O-acetyltransferase NeuD family)
MAVPIVLLGPGGNVIDMVDMIEEINQQGEQYELLGFLDNRPSTTGRVIEGYPVLGPYAAAAGLAAQFPDAVFSTWLGGINSHLQRPAMVSALGIPPERFVTLVHPSSYVSRRARLGRGVIVFQNCSITNNVTLGDHVVVLPQSVISHDDVIGEYTVVTGAVAIAGNVTVGPCCYLGTNCAIHPGLEIGEGSIVGMGSVVVRNVAPFQVVAGNPARKLRDVVRPDDLAAAGQFRNGEHQ